MGIRPNVDEPPTRGILPEPQNVKGHDKHSIWHKLHGFFGRDDRRQSLNPCPEAHECRDNQQIGARRDWSVKRVGVGLPRSATFRRQNSERRERLLPVQPYNAERRALSVSRHASLSLQRPRSKSSPPPVNLARISAPAVAQSSQRDLPPTRIDEFPQFNEPISPIDLNGEPESDHLKPPKPPSRTSPDDYDRDRFPELDERAQLNAELDSKWILNLSMHFRDKSDREKFFVTYAEQPNQWRRVTVSCDYRNAEPGSLENDLKELKFQRDKSLQIYESIRDSLPDIQFYETVTNLKLETTDGRLHVHVTEDVNEIIPYPPKSTVAHILEDERFKPMEVLESELVFDSHLSGFVYKVNHQGKTYIKKEIPGPDRVDEFLYEINALHALHGLKYVIQLEAIAVDKLRQSAKGLLISYTERGAVVDLLYDQKGEISWDDRVRWAQQAVQGLGEIYREGYMQADFTLSNIALDQENNARIIDINRRGCPVGWEPPEIAKKLAPKFFLMREFGWTPDIPWGQVFDGNQGPLESPSRAGARTQSYQSLGARPTALGHWKDQAIPQIRAASQKHQSILIDLKTKIWRRARSFLEDDWHEMLRSSNSQFSFKAIAACRYRFGGSQKPKLLSPFTFLVTCLVPRIAAQENEPSRHINARDQMKEFAFSILPVMGRWSIPTLLSTGVLLAVYRKSSVQQGVSKCEAVKVSRAAAGVGSIVAVILADPRSTAEWLFPTVFTSLVLQLLYWRSLLSDQDQHLRWLAGSLAIGAGIDGALCHLASSTNGYGLFVQLLSFSIWLTLTAFSCILPHRIGRSRGRAGFVLPT
jgi:hypothetical protein